MALGLTRQQLAMLRFIHGFKIANRGVAPTLLECIRGLGLASKASAHELLKGLEERGAIRRLPARARALDVLIEPAIPSIDGAPLYVVPMIGIRSVRFSEERV